MRSRCALVLALVSAGCPGDDPDPDDAHAWAIVAEPDASVGALLSVWGPEPGEVWAVGGQLAMVGDAGSGAVLRRDADGWSPQTIPAGTPLLNWVHGADGVTWAVGNAGAAMRRQDGAWTRADTPVTVPLWGVFAVSGSEAWAVGGDPFDAMGTGVIVHFADEAWTEVAVPMLDRPMPALFKVWGTAADDLHAVGDNGVVLHWDGSAWTQTPTSITDDLISLWGTGPAEIVAVGGRSTGVVARWDGASWTGQRLPSTPALNGIWMGPDGAAIVAGERGLVADLPPGSDTPIAADTPPTLLILHAAFGFPDGTRFAVGGNLASPPYRGIILETR